MNDVKIETKDDGSVSVQIKGDSTVEIGSIRTGDSKIGSTGSLTLKIGKGSRVHAGTIGSGDSGEKAR